MLIVTMDFIYTQYRLYRYGLETKATITSLERYSSYSKHYYRYRLKVVFNDAYRVNQYSDWIYITQNTKKIGAKVDIIYDKLAPQRVRLIANQKHVLFYLAIIFSLFILMLLLLLLSIYWNMRTNKKIDNYLHNKKKNIT